MRMTTGTLLVTAIVLVGAVVAATGWWGSHIANKGPLEREATVVVAPGSGVKVIGRKLEDAGVIAHARTFEAAVRMMGLENTLKAGEYVFEPGISLRAVVNKLALGDTQLRMVTIPEGWTVKDAIARIEKTEGLTGRVKRLPEGMLFPDTYGFRFGTDREKLMESMEARMREELARAWAMRDASVPYASPEELLIMASIVQKEAANEQEMPQIAGVFVNRLKKGMRLQSDPTVIYGADAYDGNIRRDDLRDANPFNTYVHSGLPPTPIANPGREALEAAARPAVGEELFFVSLPDRSGHVFTKTYEEHNRHVQAYWRAAGKQVKTGTTKEGEEKK